jgi:dienelactone hydrolase
MQGFVKSAVAALSVLAIGVAPAGASGAKTIKAPATVTVKGTTFVKVTSPSAASFKGAGPYHVGILTFDEKVAGTTLTPAGYTTKVDCWYPTLANGTSSIYNMSQWLPGPIAFIVNNNPAAKTIATYPTGGISKAAVAPGKFPLVLFSHGYGGFRDQSAGITSHLASWGFVVCAPDHLGRNLTAQLDPTVGLTPPTTDPNADVNDLVTLQAQLKANKVSALKGHVDVARVIALGHSAGGSASERLASYATSLKTNGTWLKGWIGMAGMSNLSWSNTVAPFNQVPAQPGYVLSGDNDATVPTTSLQTAFASLTAKSTMTVLSGAGHNVFSDICVIGSGSGGILAIARALNVSVPDNLATLATDGCKTPNRPVLDDLGVIGQITVAAARSMNGQDVGRPTTTGLSAAFPGLVVSTSRVGGGSGVTTE